MKLVQGKGDDTAPAVFLAAFGKHPGWDDHIEDIGIDTERLAAVKRLLYVQGIGGTIDSGAWENLEEGQRSEGFRHVFICRSAGDVVVGRLWSSTDGKGRARYPMVVCAQCSRLPLPWAVREVLPRLEAVREQCVATQAAADVVAAIAENRRQLRAAAQQVEPGQAQIAVSPRTLARLADCDEMGPDHQGLLRVLYQIKREMSPYLRGNTSDATWTSEIRPMQIRVPACGETTEDVAIRWVDFMLGLLDAATPIWLVLPLDEPWVDILVGEPAPQQFFCFQASREALPLASEIPYTLDDRFVAEADGLIRASREGTAAEIVIKPEAPPPARMPRRDAREVADQVLAIGRSSAFRWAVITIAAGAALLAALIAAVSLWPDGSANGPPPPTDGNAMSPAEVQRWEKLCTHMDLWFRRFQADLNDERLARWQSDEHLKANVIDVLREIRTGRVQVDPRRIANAPDAPLAMLARSPPKGANSPEAVEKTRRALETIEGIAKALGPKGWPALKQIKDLVTEYRDGRGWRKQAAYLKSVPAELTFGPELAKRVDQVAAAAAKARALEEKWLRIGKHVEALKASGQPLLAMFGDHVRLRTQTPDGAGAADDLDAMDAELDEIIALAEPIVAYVQPGWQKNLDMAEVRRVPPVAVPPSAEKLQAQHFRRWHQAIQLPKYAVLVTASDPRKKDGWQQKQQGLLTDAKADVDELRKVHTHKDVPKLEAKHKQLSEALDALAKKPWDRANKQAIELAVADLLPKIKSFRDQAGLILGDARGGVEGHLKGLPARVSGSGQINLYWQKHLKDLAKIPSLAELRPKSTKFRADMETLDSELQVALPGVGGADWNKELSEKVLLAKREETLAAALAGLAWRDGAVARDAAFEARWKKLRADFEQWRSEAAGLMTAFNGIEAALDGGALLDEKPASADETIEQLRARWQGKPIWKNAAVVRALKPVTDRLDRLAEIAKLTDRKQLAREASKKVVGGQFEAPRAAWKRLGELTSPAWPASREELDREREIDKELASAFDLPGAAARKEKLQAEQVAEVRRRWEVYFGSRREAGQIDYAVRRMRDFHLDPGDLTPLKPINQFRVSLHGFRAKVLPADGALDDKAVQKRIGEFVATVGKLPGKPSGLPPVKALLDELGKIAAAKEEGADLSKAGPSLAGWQPRPTGDGAFVQFTSRSSGETPHVLGFVRIEPPGGKPSFLCTTEVSVGLFAEVVKAQRRWPEFTRMLTQYASDEADPRMGPRTWQRVLGGEGGLRDARAWCKLPYKVEEKTFYGRADLGRPKPDHPMQHVSAAAAAYFASLLGCRLPTAGEWRCAHEKFDKAAGKGPNLRDATWKKQRDRVAELESEGTADSRYYPDAGIFWPKAAADRKEGSAAESGSGDDGLLWFAKVGADPPRSFHHLTGNVAEFVYEDPAALLKAEGAKGLADLLAKTSGKLFVVGGSALSPPSLKPDQPYPVDYTEAHAGYSDVGFRLAFAAPAESLHHRLRRLLDTQGYLTGRAD